jgi:hypothetical protein
MSKERYNQIIDDAYKNFKNNFPMKKSSPPKDYINSKGQLLTKEEFIDKCKTDKRFSEYWGLKIEEQELSHDERIILMNKKLGVTDTLPQYYNTDDEMDKNNVPTKLITVTYNNETIEIFE